MLCDCCLARSIWLTMQIAASSSKLCTCAKCQACLLELVVRGLFINVLFLEPQKLCCLAEAVPCFCRWYLPILITLASRCTHAWCTTQKITFIHDAIAALLFLPKHTICMQVCIGSRNICAEQPSKLSSCKTRCIPGKQKTKVSACKWDTLAQEESASRQAASPCHAYSTGWQLLHETPCQRARSVRPSNTGIHSVSGPSCVLAPDSHEKCAAAQACT